MQFRKIKLMKKQDMKLGKLKKEKKKLSIKYLTYETNMYTIFKNLRKNIF